MTRDVEILALRAETNRLEIESIIVLGQLESHSGKMHELVQDLRSSHVMQLAPSVRR